MQTSDLKQKLRESIETKITQLSEEELAAESRAICENLLKLIPEKSTVCAYSALETEVDLNFLITELIKRGDRVFLPRYNDNGITFHKIENLEDLIPGAFSVLEPLADFKQADPSIIDIVLVPGRAFDNQGNRLGRGKGGYDKWISHQRNENSKTKIWGVAFECQIIDDVPVEEHDQRMDEVVTVKV